MTFGCKTVAICTLDIVYYLSLTIYFQLQYGQIFFGETVEMPCDTAYDINAQDDSANMGIAIIIPMPVKPIIVPIIDNIIPKNKEPQPYDWFAGLSKSYPQFGQW